jgi:hypothetical protein
MTTVRLNILAAAAALGEFTAPELTAYTGANPSTVRQVLNREQAGRNLFERSRDGRAWVWRLKDVDAVLDEIASEEEALAALRPSDASSVHATPGEEPHTERLLASAEDAVIRCYKIEDPVEQKALAHIAINLLQAADPETGPGDTRTSDLEWWEGKPAVTWRMTQFRAMSFRDIAFGLGGSQVSKGLGHESYQQRARRIAAFASLAARRAEGKSIEPEHLRQAAETVSESRNALGPNKTKDWIRRLVRASIDNTDHLPPVAVLTQHGRSPTELFPVTRGRWHCYNLPLSFGYKQRCLWVEDWATPLLASDLLPGFVMSHDDSKESNEALNHILANVEHSDHPPAVIIASTASDFSIVAKVARAGGTFYPVSEASEGLLETVDRAVSQAIGRPS